MCEQAAAAQHRTAVAGRCNFQSRATPWCEVRDPTCLLVGVPRVPTKVSALPFLRCENEDSFAQAYLNVMLAISLHDVVCSRASPCSDAQRLRRQKGREGSTLRRAGGGARARRRREGRGAKQQARVMISVMVLVLLVEELIRVQSYSCLVALLCLLLMMLLGNLGHGDALESP